MNSLKEYIKENKSKFEEEPLSGHFERLQGKMKRKPHNKFVLRWAISVAAAAVTLLILLDIVLPFSEKQKNIITISDCENSNDVKLCYLSKMDSIANLIEILTKNLDQSVQQELMNEIYNIIEIASTGMDELPKELPEDRAKAILANYYKQNLESLEMFHDKINELTVKN